MRMTNMGIDISMPSMQAWGVTDTALTFVMWVVMMVAMMTPSAVPAILLYRTISQKQHQGSDRLTSTWLFLTGYLVTWAGFSVAATLAQWGLHRAALLTPMIASVSPLLGRTVVRRWASCWPNGGTGNWVRW